MLKHRLITGILVSAFSLGLILFAPVWALVGLMCVVYFLAQLEYCEMCEKAGYKLERIGIFVCGYLFLFATLWEIGLLDFLPEYYNFSPTHVLFFFIPVFLMIQSILRRKTEKAAECLGLSIFGIWYVAVLLSFMARLTLQWNQPVCSHSTITDGRIFLILFIVVVKMSDIGAYAFGSRWGYKIKRRLIPEISPAKSFPGLVGAYAGSLFVAISLVFFNWVFEGGTANSPLSYWGFWIIFALLMATVGVLGDLAESLLKRSFGVKDSSSRFPGMGGFLDIIDSLLFAAPFMYFFVLWFL